MPILLAGWLAGCSTTQPTGSRGVTGGAIDTASSVATDIFGAQLIPDTTVMIGPTTSYSLEHLVYWGAWAAAGYMILDPLAPNWSIEEARFPENHVHFSLAMKRYYAGGAGEARVVFHRRAKELMRAGGFNGYEVVEYSEGMESSMLGGKRTAEGVIRLTKAPG
ncbi:MAG: hypothetical protein AB1642_04020 [Pseudomonadota bacterium]